MELDILQPVLCSDGQPEMTDATQVPFRAAVAQLRSMSNLGSTWLYRFDFIILLSLIPSCKKIHAAIAVARTVSSIRRQACRTVLQTENGSPSP